MGQNKSKTMNASYVNQCHRLTVKAH